MNQYPKTTFGAVAMAIALFYGTATQAFEGPHHILTFQDFDSGTVGQMPSGWTGQRTTNFFGSFTGSIPTVNDTAFVTNNVSVSAPNSFAMQGTTSGGVTSNYYLKTVTPMSFSLTNAGQWMSYEMDINVDYITGNDGEGWTFRLWNADFSQLDVGVPRILRNGAQWRFLTVGGYKGGFNFDEWVNLRIKIVPSGFDPAGNSGNGNGWGTAYWYTNNSLLYTEVYTNRFLTQLKLIDTIDIRSDVRTTTGAGMFLDNIGIEAIPEPSIMAMAALGSVTFLCLRRRA